MILRSSAGLRSRRPGLSLIEVLLALVILVLAMVALGQLVDVGTNHGNEARAHTRGARLAQAKMAEVEAGLIPLDGQAEGQFEGEDAAWSYKVFVAEAGPPNLYTVTVNVIRDVNGKQLVVSVAQMIFDPTLMGSAAQAERPAAEDTTGTDMEMGTTP